MSKYQEALERLKTNEYLTSREQRQYYNLLQELVNKEKIYDELTNELGCPLEVITSKTAMVVRNDYILKMNIMAIGFNDGNIYFGSEWNFITRKLKDYGKTWWLKGDLSE